jgi:hypothetical protein
MKADWRDSLVKEIEAYAEKHQISPFTAGTRLAENPNLHKNLVAGKSITVDTYIRIKKKLEA